MEFRLPPGPHDERLRERVSYGSGRRKGRVILIKYAQSLLYNKGQEFGGKDPWGHILPGGKVLL